MTEEQGTELITITQQIYDQGTQTLTAIQTNNDLLLSFHAAFSLGITALIGVIAGYLFAKGMVDPWKN